ncbi:dihydrofolate reductase [Paenibacillus sp. J31TS4]|uniref:dihydrofolate reductase n=1 Tax=Paenibacillus sp. J31TS4 TaxID=2807195 RepID=UPI001B23E130|nr:dihydrofolate reductase [Paenibacillus sp. J31TS4]GIP39279.1 dihydrofolate reductase [Paenibacillus sp. J31TS4]
MDTHLGHASSRPVFSLIAAMDRGRVIGCAGGIPWRLPEEQAYFQRVTMGAPVIMGRLTYESIGRPLPGRDNIVVTRSSGLNLPGCRLAAGPGEAASLAAGAPEAFIIGGEEIYRLFLPLADRMYLTHIDASFSGDAFFPAWEPDEWRLVSEEPGGTGDRNGYRYTYARYERIRAEEAGIKPSPSS